MSNPFDQFAVDVQAALPTATNGPSGQENNDAGNPFATVFNDAPVPSAGPTPPTNKPVMNAPPMTMNGANGGYGGSGSNGYGGNAGAGYGQGPPPPQQQPPMMSMYGGSMDPNQSHFGGGGGGMQAYGQPPPPPPQGSPSMAPPTSDPFGGSGYGGGGGTGYGMPPSGPVGQPGLYGSASMTPQPPQGPPPASPNPYGAPPAALPSSNPSPNPYGVTAPMPSSNPPPPTNPSPNPYGVPAPMTAPAPAPTTGGSVIKAGPSDANDPFSSGGYGGPPSFAGGAPDSSPYGAPPAPSANDPFGGYAPAPPKNDPFGGYGMTPVSPNPYGIPQATSQQVSAASQPQQQQQQMTPYGDPFGAPQQPPQQDPGMGALVLSNQPNQAYAQIPPQQPYQHAPAPAIANDPFSVFNDSPAPAPAPSAPVYNDNALVPAQAPPPQMVSAPAGDSGDLWGDLGFDAPPSADSAGPPPPDSSVQEEKKEGDLPAGGEFYDARIFTPTLGVMFFKPQELTDSLFLNTDRSIVDGLNERPVVAFIVEGSSARSAGVELGHVLLKVNGVDVKNPKEASRLIKEGPRPLPLMFYVPNTDVVVAEGEHMVKYDTRETTAPNSAKDWKPKYVVIGGIIAQPWMMNMYRSKSEYDIAVIETQARRPVSVKVKQFSLQGARIQNDWQGPQMVKYKNKLHPWKYIVVLPVARNPIKISSPNLAQLKPVHEGIRRVLLAQQRQRGGNPHTAAPVSNRDPYSQQQYNRPPPQQGPPSHHQQQYPQNSGYAQPSGYTGGY